MPVRMDPKPATKYFEAFRVGILWAWLETGYSLQVLREYLPLASTNQAATSSDHI